MLLGARMAAMGAKPYDREVAYIHSTNKAYLVTGLARDDIDRFRIKFTNVLQVSTFAWCDGLFGICSSANGAFSGIKYIQGNLQIGNKNGRTTYAIASPASIEFEWDFSSSVINVNGDAITCEWIMSPAIQETWVYDIFSFSMDASGSARNRAYIANANLHYFQAYKNSTLVADYIPVVKDGVGYMYDKVSGQLLGNAASSGEFTWGELSA